MSGGRLAGKVSIITGASRGIGAAGARAFIAEGAKVLIGDVLEESGRALAARLGPSATFRRLDVTDPDAWSTAVEVAEETLGPLTTVVNNAGIVRPGSTADVTLADYERVIGVNQTGVLLGMQAGYRAMATNGGGSIINISSTAGIRCYRGIISYVASKWAVRGMTKAAALEMAPDHVRVNSVHPGQVHTDMNPRGPSGIPIGRMAQPEDIAALLVFLASDESSFVTGAEYVIDGGETAVPGTQPF
jgi:3alpha(or 20beta)-hydroxysteroid dehydrogenase